MPIAVPDLNAALDAEFAKRAAVKAAAASTTPAKADKVDSAQAAVIDKAKVETAGAVAGAEAGAADKAQAPGARAAPDISFFPKEFVPKIHTDAEGNVTLVLDEEGLALAKSGIEAHSTVTRLFTEQSDLRKKNESLQRSAANYDALVADPDVRLVIQAVEDKRAGKKSAAPKPAEEDPALANVDPAIIAALDRRSDAKVQAARDEAKAARDAVDAMLLPNAQRTAFNKACGEFVAANGVEQDVMGEAIRLADADLEKDGQTLLTVDPKMVPILLRPQVEVARLRKRLPPVANVNKTAATNGQAGTEGIASPTGRGGAHSDQSVPYPSHYVNGKPPSRPRTDAERTAEHLFHVRLVRGPNATAADL